MAAMTCEKLQAFLPDMLLDPAHVPADARQHLRECSNCERDWKELQNTMLLLDTWEVPEPSPYFDTRLAARLREEKLAGSPGWMERVRMRLLFGSNLQLRPLMAGAFALILVVGGGSYAGFVNLNRTIPQQQQKVSATVKDLELLDSNAQTLQQLAAFDDTSVDSGAPSSLSN
jgi:hypothetical protein